MAMPLCYCRMFVGGYEHGVVYGDMEPCIHVGILNFIQMESPGFHHKIMLLDEQTKELYSSKFVFHVIELKKLDGTLETERHELYRWAKLIAAETWEEVDEQIEGNAYMEEVKREMTKISQDEMQRYLYLREAMAASDEASRLRTATNAGMKKGLEQGLQKGVRENIRITIELLQETGMTKENVTEKLLEKYDMPSEEILQLIENYWKND